MFSNYSLTNGNWDTNHYPKFILQHTSKEEISKKTRHVTYGVFVNSESTPFSQTDSRKALALGLNKQKLLDMLSAEIQAGHSPTNSWIPEGIRGSDNSAGLALSESKELATDYWARGQNAEGISVELLYSSEDSLHAELAIELKKLWEQKLPLQVNLRPENSEEYFADLKTGRYQLAIGGWRADYHSEARRLLRATSISASAAQEMMLAKPSTVGAKPIMSLTKPTPSTTDAMVR